MDTLVIWVLAIIIYSQFVVVLFLFKIGGDMDALNAAIAKLQVSVTAANAKIDSLKAGQLDPVALQAATDAVNTAADSLDAKVAS